MNEYIAQREHQSRTLDCNKSRASRQTSIEVALQRFSEKNQQRYGDNKSIQRVAEDEEEPLQGKFADTIQRVADDEEEPLQGKFSETVQKKPNNTGLPDNLKSGIEGMSGYSMDDVRVHYNSSKPAQLQALAYTQGSDIHVAPGQEKHLPHEAWHVVQQKQGRVAPTMQMKEINVNDDAALEHEADMMGEKVIQGKFKTKFMHSNPSTIKCIQRQKKYPRTVKASANITYKNMKNKQNTVYGAGLNDADDAPGILRIFMNKGLMAMGRIEAPENGQPRGGSCAEPHAVAEALNKIQEPIKKIDQIIISKALVTQHAKRNAQVRSRNGRSRDKMSKTEREWSQIPVKQKTIKPLCKTCAQWIEEDGSKNRVKSDYLNIMTPVGGIKLKHI